MASLDIQVDPKKVRAVYNGYEPLITWGKFYPVRYIQQSLLSENNDSDCYHFEDDDGNEVFIEKPFVIQSKDY